MKNKGMAWTAFIMYTVAMGVCWWYYGWKMVIVITLAIWANNMDRSNR